MKNKELFDKTISILVKAYQEETLAHGNACACAIGNLIMINQNYKISQTNWRWRNSQNEILIPQWCHYLQVKRNEFEFNMDCALEEERYGKAIKEIKSTGYSLWEIDKIEKAFETYNGYDDPDGYKGLMNVVDALMEIHEMEEAEVTSIKDLFVKLSVLDSI